MSVSAGLTDIWHKAKAHPNIAAGVVFVVGAILVYLYYSTGGTPQQASGPTAGQSLLGQEALQTQYAATLSGQQTAGQAVAAQVNGQVAIADLNAGVAHDQIVSAGSVQALGIAAGREVDLAQIDAGKVVNLGSIQAITNLASINADVQKTQYADLFGYLNNSITSQYDYLNHQIDVNAANSTTMRILQEQGQYIGNLGTALGKLGVNVPA